MFTLQNSTWQLHINIRIKEKKKYHGDHAKLKYNLFGPETRKLLAVDS